MERNDANPPVGHLDEEEALPNDGRSPVVVMEVSRVTVKPDPEEAIPSHHRKNHVGVMTVSGVNVNASHEHVTSGEEFLGEESLPLYLQREPETQVLQVYREELESKNFLRNLLAQKFTKEPQTTDSPVQETQVSSVNLERSKKVNYDGDSKYSHSVYHHERQCLAMETSEGLPSNERKHHVTVMTVSGVNFQPPGGHIDSLPVCREPQIQVMEVSHIILMPEDVEKIDQNPIVFGMGDNDLKHIDDSEQANSLIPKPHIIVSTPMDENH